MYTIDSTATKECIEAPSTKEREAALIYFEASPHFTHRISQLIAKKFKCRCKHDFSRSATSVGIHIISAILADAEYAVDRPSERMARCGYDFYKPDQGQAKRADQKQQKCFDLQRILCA